MDDEHISPEDFGALSRANHAQQAATESRAYLIERLFVKYRIPADGAIEPDGRITRATVAAAGGDRASSDHGGPGAPA